MIIFLTLLAALLRVTLIDSPIILEDDEEPNFTWYAFIPWKDLLLSYTDPNQHTLFIVLARLSMGIFGENEMAFRLPVLLAGIFAVPLLYRVTVILFDSQEVAATASLLLTLSFRPLYYSQNGRAYSLTLFLGLAMIYAVLKIRENQAWWFRYGVLPILGLCMALALPSNIFFLVTVTIFFMVAGWDGQADMKAYIKTVLFEKSAPFVLMFVLALSYLGSILPDLKRTFAVAKAYSGASPSIMEWLTSVSGFFVEPWGVWLYLFFAYGLFVSRRDARFGAFLSIFIVPLVINSITGIWGPARTYIYWIPFIMMAVASGIVHSMSAVLKRISMMQREFNRGHAFEKNAALLMLAPMIILTVQPAMKLTDYYHARLNTNGTKIADAKKLLPYMAEMGSDAHNLVVLQSKNRILDHYLGQKALENNLRALKDDKLEGIVFIGERDNSVKKYLSQEQFEADPLRLEKYQFPDDLLKLEKAVGSLGVYRLTKKIAKVELPGQYRSNDLLHLSTQGFSMDKAGTPFSDKSGFKMINKSDDNMIIIVEPEKMQMPDLKKGYFLLGYLRKHLSASNRIFVNLAKPFLLRKKNNGSQAVPEKLGYETTDSFEFNYHKGFFTFSEAGVIWRKNSVFTHYGNVGITDYWDYASLTPDIWELHFALHPVHNGDDGFFISFNIVGNNEENIFDGMRMWAVVD